MQHLNFAEHLRRLEKKEKKVLLRVVIRRRVGGVTRGKAVGWGGSRDVIGGPCLSHLEKGSRPRDVRHPHPKTGVNGGISPNFSV